MDDFAADGMTKEGGPAFAETYCWVPHRLNITLKLRDRLIGRFDFPSAILDAPATRLQAEVAGPNWERLPAGIDVATIEAQPLGKPTPRFSLSKRSIRYVVDLEMRHFVDLRGSLADYLKSFGRKPRGNLTRAVRRFAQYSGGEIDFRAYRTGEEMYAFASLAAAISRQTHKHATHGFSDSREVVADLLVQAERELARGYILFHRGRGVAYILCLVQHENIRYRKIGYDPKYAKWSPGTVAFYCLLERLYLEQAFEYLDFEGHDVAYKAHFATHSIPCWRVIYCRPKVRLLGVILSHFLLGRLLEISSRLAHRLGLTAAIKRRLGRTSPTVAQE